MKPEQVKVGMVVNTGRLGEGTVVSDYWRGHDRFRVRLIDGREFEFTSASLLASAQICTRKDESYE